ncbi:hypothetical protein LTR50_006641 [Elasticomyces elasticus]|nr:hypothetical protein LTR50_006641 [Elasticomyces elasticus]
MTVRATKFTPKVLLSAPRRSAGIPNEAGTAVLYTISTYSFESHEKAVELRVLDFKSGESVLLVQDNGVSDPVWLEDDVFAYLKSGKEGKSEVIVGSVENPHGEHHVAGAIDAPVGSLKAKKLADGSYAVVLSALANSKGELYNPETAPKTQSTGKLYRGLFVRHWDRYVGKEKSVIWYSTLRKDKGSFKLSKLVNALKTTGLECPIPPFGGTDHFDMSTSGIIFVAKDPDLDPALNVKCNVYYIPIDDFSNDSTPCPLKIFVPGFEGASTSPVLSADGKKAAFLMMKTGGYEADLSHVFVMPDTTKPYYVINLLADIRGRPRWTRSPQSLAFSNDGESIYMTAEDVGYGRLFMLSSIWHKETTLPTMVTKHGYISDVRPLKSGSVFVSGSSLTDDSFYSILDTKSSTRSTQEPSEVWNHSCSRHGTTFGLKRSQVSEIWFPAANPSINKEVHAWVYKPSNFDKKERYPLAYLIHGGPQGSWADSWSTRWNPAIFAEAGYIVVAPNPTGSTGYGQDFTNAIRQNWGGDPYQDIVNGFEYIKENMPEVDTDRAVALGASYGGYMMNWILGHELGRSFKALVNHDGIFSFMGLLATEELYFPFYDLGGTPWSAPANSDPKAKKTQETFGSMTSDAWRKWDPSQYLSEWNTPTLVVHNSKDYRLCISEGLAAFNVLQARGVESEFLTFPDENHWVLKPENSLLWHKVVLNWINKHVGLPPFSQEDEDSDEFYGGVREKDEEPATMMAQGNGHT